MTSHLNLLQAQAARKALHQMEVSLLLDKNLSPESKKIITAHRERLTDKLQKEGKTI